MKFELPRGYLIYSFVVIILGILIISSLPLLPWMEKLFDTIFGIREPLQLIEKIL